MSFHQSTAGRLVGLPVSVLAWLILPCSALRGDAATGPSPVFVSSYRVLVRSPHPASSLINESVAFAPDGRAVASGRVEISYDQDGEPDTSLTVVSICRATDGAPIKRIELASHDGCSIAYSPDGQTLAIGLADQVKLFDTEAWKERASLRTTAKANIEKLAYSSNGERIAAASYDSIVIWDLTTGKVLVTIHGRTGFVHGVAFSPDGKTLASASEVPLGRPAARSSRWHGASSTAGGEIDFWNSDGTPTGNSFDYLKPAYDLAYSPDGKTLALAGEDGARLWLPGKSALPRAIAPTPVYCLAYSKDGRFLAMGTEEFSYATPVGEIRLWDTKLARDRFVLQADVSRVRSLAFAPDGHAVVAATREGVFMWDLLNSTLERAATPSASPADASGERSTKTQQVKPIRPPGGWADRLTFACFLLLVTGAIGMGWRAKLLVYRAREQCRWLLASWLERDGLSLVYCRTLFPLIYYVNVEDARGHEFCGWAEISGRFWSTPEYIPLRVRYFLFRRAARKDKTSTTAQKIALWDDWLDRQHDA